MSLLLIDRNALYTYIARARCVAAEDKNKNSRRVGKYLFIATFYLMQRRHENHNKDPAVKLINFIEYARAVHRRARAYG